MIAVGTIWTDLTQPTLVPKTPKSPKHQNHHHHLFIEQSNFGLKKICVQGAAKSHFKLVSWLCRSIFTFPRILSVFILLRFASIVPQCSSFHQYLIFSYTTLSAWRGTIFCAVLMFPGMLAPRLVPGGPGPGINHAFPDQAARVHWPRHYRGQ